MERKLFDAEDLKIVDKIPEGSVKQVYEDDLGMAEYWLTPDGAIIVDKVVFK